MAALASSLATARVRQRVAAGQLRPWRAVAATPGPHVAPSASAAREICGCTSRRAAFALSPALYCKRWSSGGGGSAEGGGAAGAGRARRSYWHEPGCEPLRALTLGQVAASAARRWPSREALVALHQGRRLTFAHALQQVTCVPSLRTEFLGVTHVVSKRETQRKLLVGRFRIVNPSVGPLQSRADRLAAGLLRLGLQPGDMLGLCGPNSAEWYVTNLAAARAGLITVNINPAYQTPELEYCLTKARVKALVVPDKFKTQNYPEMVAELVPEITDCKPGKLESKRLPYLKSLITISDKKFPGAITYESLMESSTDADISRIQALQDLIDPDSPCNIQFTSGTTGQPKATLLSHHGVVNNAYFTGKRLGFDKKQHRICLQIPMFHGFGNGIGIVNALHFGCTLVLPSFTFQAETSIKAIEKERCTAIFGTPTMFVDIISKNENPRAFDSLEVALTGGAPTPPQLFQKMVEAFSLQRCLVAMGMTETSPTTFLPLPQDSIQRCATSVGKVMDHTEVMVVDGKGDIVPMGQPGELLVRGYCNMLCYYNDEEKTGETIDSSRWLHTGDQIVLHEDGYAQVVGRIKDIIIRGGENIFPKEIEDFLSTHPDVLDAQVLGIPDARLGEEVYACVRLNSGSKLTAEELKNFCKGKIAHFKIPKFIRFVSDYPRTQTGKVLKSKLRDIILEQGSNC